MAINMEIAAKRVEQRTVEKSFIVRKHAKSPIMGRAYHAPCVIYEKLTTYGSLLLEEQCRLSDRYSILQVSRSWEVSKKPNLVRVPWEFY